MKTVSLKTRTRREYFDRLFDSACNINTILLEANMKRFVLNCFKAIRPLSHEPVVVVSEGDRVIVLGTFVRVKFRWKRRAHTCNESELFNVIRDYGVRMKLYVRRAILGEFSDLVDLTAKLKPYFEFNFRVDIPLTTIYKYDDKGRRLPNPIEVDSILVNTVFPYSVKFLRNGRYVDWADIEDPAFYLMTESIIEHVVELYKRAESEISAVIEHNNGIMREMERIVAPFIVAKEIRE